MEEIKKLNIGCGESKKAGYINLDWQSIVVPDVSHDLNTFPYPFRDNYFDEIEAFHVIEHLDKPFEVMRELHRILKHDGILRIKVPHFSRGFTHAEHAHGFDITFPLYFSNKFTKSGYIGIDFNIETMKISWMAFFHLLPFMGYGWFVISILKAINFVISGLANAFPALASRIWCYWVGGFEEIYFVFKTVKK